MRSTRSLLSFIRQWSFPLSNGFRCRLTGVARRASSLAARVEVAMVVILSQGEDERTILDVADDRSQRRHRKLGRLQGIRRPQALQIPRRWAAVQEQKIKSRKLFA